MNSLSTFPAYQQQWHKKCQVLEKDIENLKAYLLLSVGQTVTDGKKVGIINDKKILLAGFPEILVSWGHKIIQVAEPRQLKIEPILPSELQVGDMIKINSKQIAEAGELFEIKAFEGNGWVLTTTHQRFHGDHFSVIVKG